MKKIVSLLLISFILCACSNEKEEIAYTCRQDSSSSTYSATFNFVIRSKDKKAISSIESSSTYVASFKDTNFDNVISSLKTEEKKYKENYTDTNIDFDIKKEQVFFRVLIPINNHNLLIFKDADPDLINDASIDINKYRSFLESHKYTCK